MNETELASIVQRRVEDSLGTFGDQLSADRTTALSYYRGEPFGDEVEGRSKVVSRDVAEAVDSLMPPLLKVFLSGDKVVMFDPVGAEDEQAAEQATDYINHVFLQQNDGFRLVYTTLKDGLLFKTGVGKVYWDETPQTTSEKYHGLTPEEVALIREDPNLEIEEEAADDYGVTLTVTKTNTEGKCCVEPIPPEEFLIDRYATRLDQSVPDGPLFTGHRQLRIVSDVIAEYPDRKEDIMSASGVGGDADISGERRERFALESPGEMPDHEQTDETTRPVWVVEAYVRVDYDGDGIAELRKVTCVGESGYQVIDNEEVDDNPFAAWSPIMMPHKFHGMSIADQTIDLQRIKSTLTRGMLNNAYFVNEPMTKVVNNRNVDLDALLNRRIGGVVTMDSPEAVEEMVVPPMFQHIFPMLEYIDTIREQRTGVTRYSQGLDAEALNKTARGIMIIQDASQQRQELIARVYAEMFMKRLFALILKCVSRYQESARMIRLRGQWVPMDPRGWKTKYDMTVTVGLGTGNRDQQAAHAMNVLNIQKEFLLGGKANLVTDNNLYKVVEKFIEAIGWKSAEPYFTDPGANPQPVQQAPPDPKLVEVQMKAEIDAQKAQMDHQYRTDKLEKDHEAAMYQARLKALVDGWTAEQKADLDLAKAIDEIEIDKFKAQGEAERAEESHVVQLSEIKRKARTDRTVTREKAKADGIALPDIDGEDEEVMKELTAVAESIKGVADAMMQTSQMQAESMMRMAESMQAAIAEMNRPKVVDLKRDAQGRAVGGTVRPA